MKSIVPLDPRDLQDVERLARKIHNAICSYLLLRGRAPGTIRVHPSNMEYMLVGAVEGVIFPKGIALMSDEEVRPGTVHLTPDRHSGLGFASWTPGGSALQGQRLLPYTLRTN